MILLSAHADLNMQRKYSSCIYSIFIHLLKLFGMFLSVIRINVEGTCQSLQENSTLNNKSSFAFLLVLYQCCDVHQKLLCQEVREDDFWCQLLEALTAELGLSFLEPPANPQVSGRTCFLSIGSKQKTFGFVICLLPGLTLCGPHVTSQVCHSCVVLDQQLLMFKNHSFFFNYYYFLILILYCYSITVVCLFSPSLHPTPKNHSFI